MMTTVKSRSVEMADKHASEACALTGVGVQVSPPAHNWLYNWEAKNMESWQSGPMRGIANPLSRKTRTGSNPVLSAITLNAGEVA